MQLIAYTHVMGKQPGKRIGKVVFYETGYYPSYYDHVDYTSEQVEAEVNRLNAQIGVPEDVAESAAGDQCSGGTSRQHRRRLTFLNRRA